MDSHSVIIYHIANYVLVDSSNYFPISDLNYNIVD